MAIGPENGYRVICAESKYETRLSVLIALFLVTLPNLRKFDCPWSRTTPILSCVFRELKLELRSICLERATTADGITGADIDMLFRLPKLLNFRLRSSCHECRNNVGLYKVLPKTSSVTRLQLLGPVPEGILDPMIRACRALEDFDFIAADPWGSNKEEQVSAFYAATPCSLVPALLSQSNTLRSLELDMDSYIDYYSDDDHIFRGIDSLKDLTCLESLDIHQQCMRGLYTSLAAGTDKQQHRG
jgi:hypothetical protein